MFRLEFSMYLVKGAQPVHSYSKFEMLKMSILELKCFPSVGWDSFNEFLFGDLYHQ